jgi:predicted nucleic acid-binding protein
MQKNLVDANILLRLILKDDEALFRKAFKVVQTARPASLVTSPVIAAEVMYVLGAKGYSREKRVEGLLLLIDRPAFQQNELLRDSLRHYSQTKLDFADCYLLARCLRTGMGLQSLDSHLQKTYSRLKGKVDK